MKKTRINILIVGAGKGGKSIVELFYNSNAINIVGVVDINAGAPGIKLARELGIPTAGSYKGFLNKRIDEIINVTGSEEVQEELLKAKPLRAELIGGHSAKLMWGLIEEQKRSEGLKRDYEVQSVISSLLRLSLEDIPLGELLGRALKLLFSISWFPLEPKGAIFLAEEGLDVLTMKAQSGLPEAVLKSCGQVSFGRCLCGRAASMKTMQFSGAMDERHEIPCEGAAPHGHYCIPILSGGEILGVINTYIKEGHIPKKVEEDFLVVVANTLAGVIKRRRAEDELRVAHDELKEAQQDLVQSEKMAALGRFSSGVAHEVKNPLGIILGGIEYLENKIARPDEDIKTAFKKVKGAVSRADSILLGLLSFSRPSELKIEKVSIRDLVKEALSFYRYRTPSVNINIKTEFKDSGGFVEVDKNQMQQVIFNILFNAVEAMPRGGQIKIKTYDKAVSAVYPNNQFCVIEIKDSGVGISRENQAKIFEPFFTTKRDKKGIGLGLAVAKMIVENHKGNLTVESEAGKGTTVSIILFRK